MTPRSAALGIVAIIILAAGVLYLGRSTAPAGTSVGLDEQAVRATVADLGSKLKNVSLLAPDVAAQIQTQYAADVAPELLQTWVASTTLAPGRYTSSPWPDRIDIDSVEQIGEGQLYRVIGSVVEVTSAGPAGQPAATYPVYMELEMRGGQWLITEWQKNPYTED